MVHRYNFGIKYQAILGELDLIGNICNPATCLSRTLMDHLNEGTLLRAATLPLVLTSHHPPNQPRPRTMQEGMLSRLIIQPVYRAKSRQLHTPVSE